MPVFSLPKALIRTTGHFLIKQNRQQLLAFLNGTKYTHKEEN